MSLPETCPFCGSFAELRNGEKWVGYTCITTIHAGHDARRLQSANCAGLERTRLLAYVEKLEARCNRLQEVGDMIVDEYMVEQPEKDAWKQAKEAKP